MKLRTLASGLSGLCAAAAIAWAVAYWPVGAVAVGIDTAEAVAAEKPGPSSLAAKDQDALSQPSQSEATTRSYTLASADPAVTLQSLQGDATLAALAPPEPVIEAALPDKPELSAPDPSALPEEPSAIDTVAPFDPVNSVEILDECPSAHICVDRYLWALYERAPKIDAHKVYERRKVTVRNKKGKRVTVMRTFSKLVDEDFTWKDPKAADKVGMAMTDYVIGGMDRSFKLKLFRALHAAAHAGLMPGITSAFRDDYRQSIASGKKAATGKSFHGGSTRGGYGHGLAADVVSIKGATRAQRWVSTVRLWKWLDENGKEFGIGRPYLDRDPPHFAPVDGKEYAAHYRAPKAQQAASPARKPAKSTKVATRADAPRQPQIAASAD